MFHYCYNTSIGPITLVSDGSSIVRLDFGLPSASPCHETPLLARAAAELLSYLAGDLRAFTVPVAPVGTPFMRSVWDAVREIPYGRTASYGEIAAAIGNPRASRAVGMANHRNPVPIIIPCHRVIGGDGSLTGYGGGLPLKERLLALERGGISADQGLLSL